MPFELLFLFPIGAVVALRLLRDCEPLRDDDTTTHGALLFSLGYLAMLLSAATLAPLFVSRDEASTNPYSNLPGALGLQSASMIVAVAVMVMMARTLPRGVRGQLGLRPHSGPLPVLTAIAAWVGWVPVIFIAATVNTAFIEVLGLEVNDTQLIVQSFLADAAGRAQPIVWLSAAVVIPIGEEVLFRGALQGGLRRWMPPSVAAAMAALVFGSLHDAASMLPVAALGFLLGLLYERTRSLVLPIVVHVLHNTLQLLLLTFVPETLT